MNQNNIIGLIMAGGKGSRLVPVTSSTNKHILPVFDKPMIFYPFSLLLLNKIKEIIIVINQNDLNSFKQILGEEENYGVKIHYVFQKKPRGVPEGIKLSKHLIKNKDIFMLLGDNILFGSGMSSFFEHIWTSKKSCIYPYIVNDPNRYGVIKFKNDQIKKITEKPKKFISEWIVTGQYFIKNQDLKFLNKLKFSNRNELEISEFFQLINKKSNLDYKKISRGFSWNDVGTFESLLECSNMIYSIQKKQGLEISNPHEIAYRKKLISKKKYIQNINKFKNSAYGEYLSTTFYKDKQEL